MPPLPNPSISPLPSYASRPIVTHRAPSFGESLRSIVRWLINRQSAPPKAEQQLEARIIERLVAELTAPANDRLRLDSVE